jgi:hypothetical protein
LSLDCVITVPGKASGRGSPRRDLEAPVKDLLTDLTGYYRAVFRHVVGCPRCEPDEVLRRYLHRRESLRKFGGMTSKGLCELALRYEADPRRPADPALVDEFFVRSGDWRLLQERRRLPDRQVARGLAFQWRRWALDGPVPRPGEGPRVTGTGPLAPAVREMARLYGRGGPPPEEGELLRLLAVASVMLS